MVFGHSYQEKSNHHGELAARVSNPCIAVLMLVSDFTSLIINDLIWNHGKITTTPETGNMAPWYIPLFICEWFSIGHSFWAWNGGLGPLLFLSLEPRLAQTHHVGPVHAATVSVSAYVHLSSCV